MAMQMAQEAAQQNAQRQATLDTWAANHATSWNQLAGQLGQTSAFQTQAPTVSGVTGYRPTNAAPVSTGFNNFTGQAHQLTPEEQQGWLNYAS
jgi:hypothetical protein